jgi:hypothetical protein
MGVVRLAKSILRSHREVTEVIENAQGKAHRAQYQPTESRATGPGLLYHMDLLESGGAVGPDGERYTLCILDDFSGLSVAKAMVYKSDAPRQIQQQLQFLSAQCGVPLRAVRTDRGGEFLNHHLGSWFTSLGVKHEYSAPGTPQQNGRAERLNQTLQESARSMLAHAQLPDTFWVDAVHTASYLRNRLPTAGRDSTPIELFCGRKPDLRHLRTFGCDAYVWLPKPQRESKYTEAAVRGVFVGYASASKAYRVYVDGRIYESKDVRFFETTFTRATAAQPAPASTGGSAVPDAAPAPPAAPAAAPPPAPAAAPVPVLPEPGAPQHGGAAVPPAAVAPGMPPAGLPAAQPVGRPAEAQDGAQALESGGAQRSSARSNKGKPPGEWWKTPTPP